ncbi:Uncharacterised protein [Mycobacteroides abscessus subsp. abscessus]|nr:Uncharacterised protein [Mycobacteroides abscessus subsp. abscessus]
MAAADPRVAEGYRALSLRTAQRADTNPALIDLLEGRR